MKKTYLTGIVAVILLTFAITNAVYAHGNKTETENDNMPISTWQNMMSNNKNYHGFMHDLMWNNEDITEDEFKSMIELQKDHMGFSWLENSFKNSQEFNQWHQNNNMPCFN